MSLYDVFLSHASADKPAVERLARKLRENGVNPFLDSWHLIPGRLWQPALERALVESRCVAIFIGSEGMGPWERQEMLLALDRGAKDEEYPVIPVLLPGAAIPDPTPAFLLQRTWVQFEGEDDERALRRLLAGIRNEPPEEGSSSLLERGAEKPYRFIGPKTRDRFIHRREYKEAVQALLGSGGDRGTTVGLTTALQGAGGFGKTALALELCHDTRIRQRYPDGILWAQMRDNMSPDDRLKEIRDLLRRWTNQDPPSFETVAKAGQHLIDLLKGKSVLLIVDDAWRPEDITPFLGLDDQASLLITTRDRRTLPAETIPIRVGAMQESEAVQLLGDGILAEDLERFRTLSTHLGEWPILLKLVNGQLREMIREDGFSFEQAIRRIERALKEEGITAFDRDDVEVRNAAVARTVEVSLERLGDNANRFRQLAIFPEDEDIPLSVLVHFWGIGLFQAEKLCSRLYSLSLLLYFDRQTGKIRLHDVIRFYLLGKEDIDLREWHERLLSCFKPVNESWPDLPREEGYLWRHLFHHLTGAGQENVCRNLLLDFSYLKAKLNLTDINSLLADATRFESDDDIRLVRDALRLSAHVLTKDPAQLRGQLLGRLLSRQEERVRNLLLSRDDSQALWIRPKGASLHRPGGRLVRTIDYPDRPNALAVLPDGEVISGSDRGIIQVWNVENGQVIRTFERHPTGITNIAILNSRQIVSGDSAGMLTVWDVETGKTLFSFAGHFGLVNGMAALGERRAVSGSADGKLRVWNIENGEVLRVLGESSVAVRSLAALNEERVVAGYADGTLRLWDLEGGQILDRYDGHSFRVRVVAALTDGHVVSGSRDNMMVWDSRRKQSRSHHLDSRIGIRSLATLDDHRAVFGFSDGSLLIWDVDSGRILSSWTGHSAWVRTMAVLNDGRLISGSGDGTLRIWALGDGSRRRAETKSHPIRAVKFKEAGQVVSGFLLDEFSVLRVWQTEKSTSRNYVLAGEGIEGIEFLGGDRVLAGCADGTLRIWKLGREKEVQVFKGHSSEVCSVTTLDSRRVVSASRDKTLRVWDLESGETLQILNGHSDEVRVVRVLEDERVISGSNDGSLRVWDVKTGETLQVLRGHSKPVRDIAVLDHEPRVVSASEDGDLRVWNWKTGKSLRTLRGHSAWVRSVLALGKLRIISSSDDHTLRVWDIETGETLCQFTLDARVTALALSPDRQIVAAGDASGRTHLFDLVEPSPAFP